MTYSPRRMSSYSGGTGTSSLPENFKYLHILFLIYYNVGTDLQKYFTFNYV